MEELITRVLRNRAAVVEMLDFRRIAEPAIAEVAAVARRERELQTLRSAIADMSNASTEPDYMRYDTEVHIAIARSTENRFMASAIEEIRRRLNDVMTLLPKSHLLHHRISGEQDAIFKGIESRDGATAAAAMQVHIANSEQGLRAVLEAVRHRVMN
jgi:GntR family transcriptional repressor for pyruvate dehydrogenase complex